MRGRRRCYNHGGNSYGWLGPRSMVAANLAKVAYFAERRRRKALGLPVRPHGGLRIKGEPYLITKARVMVKSALVELGKAEAIGDAATFNRLRSKSLRAVETILDLPNTLEHFDGDQAEHHKRLRMQLEAAQGIIANAVKIDESSLRHQEESDKIELWREELKNIKIPSKSG